MDIQEREIQAMKEIVDVCVGIPLFTYEMQLNAPRPEGQYAAVKCISSSNPGYDETRLIDDNGVEKFRTRGIRILTFYILFSRDGQEYIDFDNSFYRPDVNAKLREHGFAALGKEALNLATVQLETNWEVRKGIKMQFNVLREQLSEIGTMSDAVVGGKFVDGDQVITIKG
ncbi:hypothetical protein Fifi44_00060 [Erwinia phage Fifi44]|uniref:Phage neck terminator protein gp12-like domain-containing protein n=1 Tax=Erwinia phage Fifi44 TaxID=2876597 RepID=A0AAE8Y1B0_9CAUD|nr:hypothetical protein QNG95_gp60 [Erwinia phage Fifi44]QQV88363.1 hypothetical protein pEaSNUABM27_00061 [Erwinia phage pEa_SNUABM_27]UCR74929.1 hypothetical protein Fifi44_00060 [Erwinia phage Fifi44]UCR80838.1 hypothetical protein Fifi451_00018 [Erwinia phage Fifi451]WJN63694.1 putative tail completion protein [Erwinia phage Aioli]